jgi:very-short-patch-repair endonuclease
MPGRSHSRAADRVIAELAARQHGVVARAQLLAAAVSRDQIDWRLRNKRLHEAHRGVYLVGHTVPTYHSRDMAALLACGEGSVLSHRSAAAIWDLLPYPAGAPAWVTVPPERAAVRPGIRIHRASLPRVDVRRRRLMPLASPPRTVLDLAGELGSEELERLVAEAEYRRLASLRELRAQLDRNPRKRGNATLRSVLDLPGGPRRTRSPAEQQMLRLLRRAGVTGYETNARIVGYEVDLLWRDIGLAVEIDGYDAHSGRIAFERDRLKIATLNANGLRVVPFTARQLRDDPGEVLVRLLRGLELAGYWGAG